MRTRAEEDGNFFFALLTKLNTQVQIRMGREIALHQFIKQGGPNCLRNQHQSSFYFLPKLKQQLHINHISFVFHKKVNP